MMSKCTYCGCKEGFGHNSDCPVTAGFTPENIGYIRQENISIRSPNTVPPAPLEKEIRETCHALADFLVEKNRSYGNSAAEPVDVFSKGLTPLQKMDVRIDDKLSRLFKGSEYIGEDTYKDLAGYLVLRMIVVDQEGASK